MAFELHTMNFFMKTMITFDEVSKAKVSNAFPDLTDKESIWSSRLLTRQLKSLMHFHHMKQLNHTLRILDNYMRQGSAALWPVCFCVMLIISLCTEDIQTAVENIMFDEGHPSHHICCKVEVPYDHLSRIFHHVYGTHEERSFKP